MVSRHAKSISCSAERMVGQVTRNMPPSTAGNSKRSLPPDPMTALLLFAFATFVGNYACRPCHADIVRKYEATPMARSTGLVARTSLPAHLSMPASGLDYVIAKDGRVTIRNGAKREEKQFDYVIGSGAAGFSYLIFRDRYLWQAPITWYSQKRRWDAGSRLPE